VNNFLKKPLDKWALSCYIITMETIMISPTNEASQRTKNRIREKGPVFKVESTDGGFQVGEQWLLRVDASEAELGWFGWLPRNEFHVECVGEKFIEKVLG